MDGGWLTLAPNPMSHNGRLPTTLPKPIKRARTKDLCGFAGEGNVAERSERMRAKRSPTSPELYSGPNRFKRGAWAGWLCAVRIVFNINSTPNARRARRGHVLLMISFHTFSLPLKYSVLARFMHCNFRMKRDRTDLHHIP